MAKRETFKEARERLLTGLENVGIEVHRKASRGLGMPLKEPYAVFPHGQRVTFKTQAIYVNAHSLTSDMRDMPVTRLIYEVSRRTEP